MTNIFGWNFTIFTWNSTFFTWNLTLFIWKLTLFIWNLTLFIWNLTILLETQLLYYSWNLTIFTSNLTFFTWNMAFFSWDLTIFTWNQTIFTWNQTLFEWNVRVRKRILHIPKNWSISATAQRQKLSKISYWSAFCHESFLFSYTREILSSWLSSAQIVVLRRFLLNREKLFTEMTETSNLLVDDDSFIGDLIEFCLLLSSPSRTSFLQLYYITFILIFLVLQGPNR